MQEEAEPQEGVEPYPEELGKQATEFSCGREKERVTEEEEGGALVSGGLYQYDGELVEGAGHNGLDCFLRQRVPALSVTERLTELHGAAALGFSSALAAQAAARSYAFASMEEQTFGDDGEEEEEDEEGE